MDNKGQHLSTNDDSPINIPAVAAAYVIKRYVKQADDELSLEVCELAHSVRFSPNWLFSMPPQSGP